LKLLIIYPGRRYVIAIMTDKTDELLSRLEIYTNIDSSTRCKEGVNQLSRVIEKECREAGLTVLRYKQDAVGDFLEITAGCGRKKILLLGHMDTVFQAGTVADRPFTRKGNYVYGPGVLDMKGGVSIIVEVMKDMLTDIPADCRVTAFLNSDEETGSKYSENYIKEQASTSVAVLSFEGAKPATLTTERKGIIPFDLELTGIDTHSGVNYHLGSSAIEAAACKIKKLYALRDNKRGITVNVGLINGGNARNIIAQKVRMEGEIRYFVREDRAYIMGCLSEIVNMPDVPNTSTIIHISSDRPPLTADDRCVRLFEVACYESEMLGRQLSPRKTGGGGDASFAAMYPIPVLDGLGPEGEDSHTEKEFVLVDSLSFKAELASRIIRKITNEVF
jgi:glutamate carboxypeptidase